MGKDKKIPAGMYDAENERIAKLAEGIEAHEYKVSFSGMCCGAMVMRDGSGDDCGLPYSHELHIGPKEVRAARDAKLEKLAYDAKEAEKPGPLAEVQERTFEYSAVRAGAIGTIVENAIDALYQRVKQADYVPVDWTLTVDVARPDNRTLTASIRTTVRAWKAVVL